jgi:hypothetical protein
MKLKIHDFIIKINDKTKPTQPFHGSTEINIRNQTPLTMNTVYRQLTDQKVTLHQGSPNIVRSNAFHNPWINVEPRGLNDGTPSLQEI